MTTWQATLHERVDAPAAAVTVRRYAGRLVIAGAGGESAVPVRQLRRGARVGTSLVLHHADQPDWYLTVHDVDANSWLNAVRPRHARPSRAPRIAAATAAVLAVLAAASWSEREELIAAAAPLLPHEVTEPIGRAYVAEAGPACTRGAGRAALDRLVARVVAGAALPAPLTVTVVDTADVNALALPGGHVVLLRGLIDQARSADELAGELAHEIAHVDRQHPEQSMLRQMGPTVLARVLGSDAGRLADLTLLTRGSVAAEGEADGGAIAYLRRARISTAGVAGYFERQVAAGDTGDFNDSHPSSAARAARYRAAAANGDPALNAADWSALRKICG